MEGFDMELKDTIELMTSEDYKDRFKVEYFQTKIRYEKLSSMLIQKEAGTLGFEPTCSLRYLVEQQRHMREYIRILEIRAEIEKISLS